MDKEQFTKFLDKNILPIFTGSEIVGEEPSSPRDQLVAQGNSGTLLVKYNKADDYRMVIKRLQPFKKFEITLVRSIMSELVKVIGDRTTAPYLPVIQRHIIERAICKSVSEKEYATLLTLVNLMTKWSSRTYEGNDTEFGFIVLGKKAAMQTNKNLQISSVLNENFSAVLADGSHGCLEVTSDGYLIDYVDVKPSKKENIYAPFSYINLAEMCTGTKSGVTLTKDGDILMFKDQSLTYAKKGGTWVRYSHEEIIDRIADKSSEAGDQTRKSIYLSALDVSFARTGGCVVHLNKDSDEEVLKHIDEANILIEKYYDLKMEQKHDVSFFNLSPETTEEGFMPYSEFLKQPQSLKIASLRNIIKGKKFYELSRKLREDLLSIDGATIINNEGDILAVGAIVKIEDGGFAGGRLAAAKTLAKFGVSLKISNDGQIQGFKMDKSKLRSVPIFMLG